MSDTPEIRVGHADRNAALDRLGAHFADGYLELSEFEDRTARAATVRTRADLDALFSDLPAVSETAAAPAPVDPAQAELEAKMEKKKRVDLQTASCGW